MSTRPLFGICLMSVILCLYTITNFGPSPMSLDLITTAQEIKYGETQFHVLQSENKIFTQDPEMTKYVQEVGNSVAKVSDNPNLPYEFLIENDFSVNARCFPGGKIV